VYVFAAYSKDFCEVYIDGEKIMENTGTARNMTVTKKEIKLKQGFHSIRARYRQGLKFAGMQLKWTPPGGAEQLIPYNVLFK
jgi:hypothetical protein